MRALKILLFSLVIPVIHGSEKKTSSVCTITFFAGAGFSYKAIKNKNPLAKIASSALGGSASWVGCTYITRRPASITLISEDLFSSYNEIEREIGITRNKIKKS